MTDFLLCIGRYVVEMAALALIGGLRGYLVGIETPQAQGCEG